MISRINRFSLKLEQQQLVYLSMFFWADANEKYVKSSTAATRVKGSKWKTNMDY
jgi:hypothetical protein